MITYKDLVFYKKAHEFTLEVYRTVKTFPKEEQGYNGLVSQLKRAASSVPANIVEGSGRSTIKDSKNFFHIALGSAKECEYWLLLAKDLEYISVETYDRLLSILNIIIGSLINYLKKM